MDIKILAVEEVLKIHEILVADFAESDDPIYPPGVKSLPLLESAVGRQWTALGRVLKYPTPQANAATLLYGICNDHPFHNGNKRTAVVAMLVHLDKNRLTFFRTRQNELYSMILAVANHSFGERLDPRSKRLRSSFRRRQDEEVRAISDWISKKVARVVRGEKQITFRQLRHILGLFNYRLGNPQKNSTDVLKREEVQRGIVRRSRVVVDKRIGNIPWPGEGVFVPISVIKQVRRLCGLREEDGVDTDAFYSDTSIIDGFVNKYRTLLRRLARK